MMIRAIIDFSLKNRVLILILAVLLAAWGWRAMEKTPLDAIPDLSDVQVIIKTSYPGQAPQVVEDQVTYPIASVMMSVPGAKVVRGYSFFGDSYVYVIFEDGADLYWARSRVLEYLNQVQAQLPPGVTPTLGPDASGVGWVFEYALVDRSHRHDLADLRTLQDWFLKYELQAIPGVSEVATVGGMVKQYQVVVDPVRLQAYGLPLTKVSRAIREASRETGASVIELGEAEYAVRMKGYVTDVDQLRKAVVAVDVKTQLPIRLEDVAEVRLGPQMRRGIAELNGEGEVVGGIVIMRDGENALDVINRVKQRIAQLKKSLPEGVEIVTTYDRSALIKRAVNTLRDKLIEEMIVVALVSLLFLFHMRSALVAVIALPLGILGSFIIMRELGISANIMSLGGIAIAIGAMVDAAIVMIENAHKHLEHYEKEHGHRPRGAEHWRVIREAAIQVGPALFVSLLIITLSFLPVFALEGQEGRLFSPLAYTKTFAMAVAAGLSITLVPVLMGYWIRGRIVSEARNPLNRLLVWLYRPFINGVLRWPLLTLALMLVLAASVIYPWQKLGTEFMPALEEGDLLYMPTTLPGVSIAEARRILQTTDALIKTFPEVKSVFGKVGRAETATDPAPLTMIETTIQLKPRDQWRPGMTLDKLITELDRKVRLPGLTNAWVQPIRTRIDMQSTGIKTPIGIKVTGEDLATIQKIGTDLERVLGKLPGVRSVFSERVSGGRYIEILPDRDAAARYGLNMEQLAQIIASAVGGRNLAQTIEGRERYPINLRYPQQWRNSVEALKSLPIVTPSGAQVPLGEVAQVKITLGPPMIKSENARLTGWTFVDLEPGVDLAAFVRQGQQAVADNMKLPPGYSLSWTGQYEYMLRAQAKLQQIVPVTLLVIFILLYLVFHSVRDALLVMLLMPFALVGSLWLIELLDYRLSVAVGVGMIALAGVAAEFGVVVLLYIREAIAEARASGRLNTLTELRQAIVAGTVKRVRPMAMTVSVVIVGLLPIMWSDGTGADVMKRIAAPMIGGMVTAPMAAMLLLPALVYLLMRREIRQKESENA